MPEWITDGDISDFGGGNSPYPEVELFVRWADLRVSLLTRADPTITWSMLAERAANQLDAGEWDEYQLLPVNPDGTIKEFYTIMNRTAAIIKNGDEFELNVDDDYEYAEEDLPEL